MLMIELDPFETSLMSILSPLSGRTHSLNLSTRGSCDERP